LFVIKNPGFGITGKLVSFPRANAKSFGDHYVLPIYKQAQFLALMRSVVSAAYQFKEKYGGDYTSRTLENGNVYVFCLEAPQTKHPAQLEEEWLAAQEKKKSKS
jgi:hypothetical protein